MKAKKWMVAALSAASLTCAAQGGYRPDLPLVDVSEDTSLQVVVAPGTPDLYQGHPTSVLMGDGKTIIATWSRNHGGPAAFIGRSPDGGRSWEVLNAPAAWEGMVNCPSIYRMQDKQGKERLVVFTGTRDTDMFQSISEDGGHTWTEARALGKPCIMGFTDVIPLGHGRYLGVYHRDYTIAERYPMRIWQAYSADGGVTWEESRMVAALPDRALCEPALVRSPNGKQLCCVMRENLRKDLSFMMFSDDEGKTWTTPRQTPWGLTGDRHVIRYLPDGRIIAVFRDMAPASPTRGHFLAWVGTYDDLLRGGQGQYRIKLLHSYAGVDCGYPGLEILPDGTIVALTYIKYRPGPEKHSIVAVRFRIEDTDRLLKRQLEK